jgi:hypothetical protein
MLVMGYLGDLLGYFSISSFYPQRSFDFLGFACFTYKMMKNDRRKRAMVVTLAIQVRSFRHQFL